MQDGDIVKYRHDLFIVSWTWYKRLGNPYLDGAIRMVHLERLNKKWFLRDKLDAKQRNVTVMTARDLANEL
jgi:hypothetical protein